MIVRTARNLESVSTAEDGFDDMTETKGDIECPMCQHRFGSEIKRAKIRKDIIEYLIKELVKMRDEK